MLILVYTHTVICEVYYVKCLYFREPMTMLFIVDNEGLTDLVEAENAARLGPAVTMRLG
jgi:hypothetical protein